MKTIDLANNEKIVAVTPEYCSGPGWSNAVAWIHIVDFSTGKYRCEDIQRNEQSPKLRALFRVAASVCDDLLASVPTKRRLGAGG